MGPLEFGVHKLTGNQIAMIRDNLKRTCLFTSSVRESSL